MRNFMCWLRGHDPKLELLIIPKGQHAASGFKAVTAVFAVTYYGARVTCKRCGDLLDYQTQEEYKP